MGQSDYWDKNLYREGERIVNTKFILDLDSISDLNKFVSEISSEISSDVNAIYERQVVDAKSFLGLVTISTHPVTVVINSTDNDEIITFRNICEKYKIIEE